MAALLMAVGDALQSRLGAVSVQGELSGFTRAASGHCYFQLKDADGQTAVLRCAMFRRAAALLDFRPADGQMVELRGRITVYEARGELQCVAESMSPLGAGSLYELFLRLKAALQAQGLFDPARKRALPAFPHALGIVTSLQAAALHDVVSALSRRAPHVRLVIYPSAVQGSEAPTQLVQAIERANARAEVDALLLCRGGGSLEDLWAFNDEKVVRAVAASVLPVVCGVGHETDLTLAELAADVRAPTPTAAAEMASPVASEVEARLRTLAERAQRALRHRLEQWAQRLDLLAMRFGQPGRWLVPQQALLQRLGARRDMAALRRVGRAQADLADTTHRRATAMADTLRRHEAKLDELSGRLAGVDPRRVLARGYAWLGDSAGRPVLRGASLQPGDRLDAQWADARATVTVIDVRPSLPLE